MKKILLLLSIIFINKLNAMDLPLTRENLNKMNNTLTSIQKFTDERYADFMDATLESDFQNIDESDKERIENQLNDAKDILSDYEQIIKNRPKVYFAVENEVIGLDPDFILITESPFITALKKHTMKEDGSKNNPFSLEVSLNDFTILTDLISNKITLNENSEQNVFDLMILAKYFALENSPSIDLKKLYSSITEKIQQIVPKITIYDSQTWDAINILSKTELFPEINEIIPPVYLIIEDNLHGLRKDHLLLQSLFIIPEGNIGKNSDGSIERPFMFENINYSAFEELVKKIQNNHYKLFESYNFETNIDFYNNMLFLVSKLWLLHNKKFDNFIFNFAKTLNNNSDKFDLLNEDQRGIALNIISYYSENYKKMSFEERPDTVNIYDHHKKVCPLFTWDILALNIANLAIFKNDICIDLENQHESHLQLEEYVYDIYFAGTLWGQTLNAYLIVENFEENTIEITGYIDTKTNEVIRFDD